MPETDLGLLIEAAHEAARIATRHIGGSLSVREKPGGAGPVTDADLEVDAVLAEILRGARPDYGWLSEESAEDPGRHEAERVFIIDPIDGTRAFIDGSHTWAHSLAVAHGGTVIAAVVYLPLRDKLYTASRGGGARLNDRAIAVSGADDPDDAEVLATRPHLDAKHWPRGVPGFRRSHRPSLAYRLSLVAEGRFDAMLTLRPTWEWDIAAGALILEEAGALATDRAGRDLRFNNAGPRLDGVVAGNPALHAALMDRLVDPQGA